MNEQFGCRAEGLAVAYTFPQRIDGAQRFQPRGEERPFLMLYSRRMRAVAQVLEEGVGQVEVRAHPAFACAVREVEVQPDEVARSAPGAGLRQPIERTTGVDGHAGHVLRETKA